MNGAVTKVKLAYVKTASMKKKRPVIAMGDSLCKGAEGPICWLEPLLRKVCCLSEVQVPTLVWPSDNYPLLVSQVGSDEVAPGSPRAVRRDFRALE